MPSDAALFPEPGLLVGEAGEEWSGDALFYEYSVAADPIGSGAISRVPVRQFPAVLHRGGPTRMVVLDLSDELGVPYPATSPGLLAAFVVVHPGESIITTPDATSELYYVMHGSGQSRFDTRPADTRPADDSPPSGEIRWRAGDFLTLPAGCTTEHTADLDLSEPDPRAVLYRVTDAPLLHYLGVRPDRGRFRPTHFDGIAARARLAEIEQDPRASQRSRVSVLLANSATPQTLTVTHALWAMLGVLPADRVQRPHRHQSVALDLITECSPGCYSLVGAEVDRAGRIIDPVRVDWEPDGAFVTPAGMWHSHHNESGSPAYLIPIQDAGLHTYLRTLDIRFVPSEG